MSDISKKGKELINDQETKKAVARNKISKAEFEIWEWQKEINYQNEIIEECNAEIERIKREYSLDEK